MNLKIVGIIINVFLPGIGTLVVRKWGQAAAQIALGLLAAVFIFTAVGAVIGVPLAFIVWLWAIISTITAPAEEDAKVRS